MVLRDVDRSDSSLMNEVLKFGASILVVVFVGSIFQTLLLNGLKVK